MPIPWEPVMLIALIVMVIPVAILIGQRWRGGPLASLSAGAILGVVAYLALSWATIDSNNLVDSLIASLSLVGGALLLLGAWTLALVEALGMRRRGVAAALCVALSAAVYATLVGMYAFTVWPITYCTSMLNGPFCAPPEYGRFAFLGALSLVGPAALLAFALRAGLRRQPGAIPEGLVISSLDAD